MAKRTKPASKRGPTVSKLPRVGAGELLTLLDFVRYAASRFVEAELVFAHGTTDPVAEAAFIVCEIAQKSGGPGPNGPCPARQMRQPIG